MNTPTTVTSRAVQSDNFKALTAAKLTLGEQRVMNAVLLAHGRHQRDLSLNELCNVMEEQLGKRINPNGISGRVTSLVASGRLARAESRACSVTGANCNPVFAVARQADLGLARPKADIHGAAAKVRVDVARSPVAGRPQTDTARVGGMPPEVRARLAAIKAEAAQGR